MADGNYLGKKRKNYFLSGDCCRYIVELAFRLGLSEAAIIELAVRSKYEEVFGERPWSRDPNEPEWN